MIGQLRGIILEKQPPLLLLEVGGIGYEIDAPMSTFYRLPDVGQSIVLHTHFVVREDAHCLYGFFSQQEKTLFRYLLRVNGVGPRLGLAILSSMTPEEFFQCVLKNDKDCLVRIPGVGKKTAERLMIEMRDKVANAGILPSNELLNPITGSRKDIIQDAISALITLGLKAQEANRAVAKIDDGFLSSEEIIRRCLQEMAV